MDAMSAAERADFERWLRCIAHTRHYRYPRNQPEPRASLELRPTW
jgi:hypothetical protein